MTRTLPIITLLSLLFVLPETAHSAPTSGSAVRHRGNRGRLRLKARARLLRRRVKRQLHRTGTKLRHLDRKSGFRRLRVKLGTRLSLAAAYGTDLADRLQARLPGSLGRAFAKLRLVSLSTAGAFAARKFKQDAGFLASFGVISPTVLHLSVPVAIAAGVNPALAVVGHEVLEVPLNLGVIAWRQHVLAKRKNPQQTFRGTLRQLGREYRGIAEEGRARNRHRLELYRALRHKRPQPRSNTLSAMATAL